MNLPFTEGRIAINIVATFLHNEPTSFSAIQEVKMPDRIYDAIKSGMEPQASGFNGGHADVYERHWGIVLESGRPRTIDC